MLKAVPTNPCSEKVTRRYYYKNGRLRTALGRAPNVKWAADEIALLREAYPRDPRRVVMKLFPGRSWFSIDGRAKDLGLKRPGRSPISSFLNKPGDIGFSAGMIIADGSVMETWIITGKARGKLEGGGLVQRRITCFPRFKFPWKTELRWTD